jgi:hypothetical protein
LRKYLIAAVAAVAAISCASVAFAQGTDTATLKVSVSPKDAGTLRKPQNVKYSLNVVNGNTSRTMSDLDIFIAKTARLSLKGLPKCAPAKIFARSCPSSTVLGRGEAKAKVGVNGAPENIRDLLFEVTAYKTNSPVTGKEMLGFFIDDGGAFQFLTETKLTKASGKYGQKLHIDVPELAQRVGSAPNFTYNGLVSLKTTLSKKVGRHYLVSTTGCVARKHPYKVDLTFIDNQVTTAAKISKTANASCTK